MSKEVAASAPVTGVDHVHAPMVLNHRGRDHTCRWPHRDNAAAVHDGGTVGEHRGKVEVVQTDDECNTGARESAKKLDCVADGRKIEVIRRLVKEEGAWFLRERTSNLRPLMLAAGESVDRCVLNGVEPASFKRVIDDIPVRSGGRAEPTSKRDAAKLYELPNRKIRRGSGVLRDERNAPCPLALPELGSRNAIPRDGPMRLREVPCEAVEQCAFPGAVRAEEPEDLARAEIERGNGELKVVPSAC
ncbi:hypothetical protein BJ960_000228 [Leucobacter aridicollis]|uniref:Uncharacterized protein n=1 Tax=Leucobacter aridicollis TaxID=283878 RepID=A0A852R167_9MICO|nr:hypothetical protein [Leucobacter aridicollis]NYD25425.1 hypothetical protein [Leucobacter aridicollis]